MATETNVVRMFIDFCAMIKNAEVDENRTTVSAWKIYEEFQENLKHVDLGLLTKICEQSEELRQLEKDGKLVVDHQTMGMAFPTYMEEKPSVPSESPVEPVKTEPIAEPIKEDITATPETPVVEETEDEWIPIDWIDKIPIDKYSIDPHGHVRNNRQNGSAVLPFMKNGQLSVKLTGVIRAGKKNPMSTTVPINNLLEIVFRKMQAAAKKKQSAADVKTSPAQLTEKPIRPKANGRYRIEDLSVPMQPLAPPVKDEPEKIGPIPLAEGYPDFARIDFVPMVPPDKYIIYQDGSVVNKQTGRTLTIKTSTTGQPRYCLLGEDNYRAYRTIGYLLICAFARDRAKAQGVLNSNMKPRLINITGPLCLSNIDMDYYQ